MNKTLAAIDCGTNSTRLLIVEQKGPSEYETLLRETQITRLGEGIDLSKELRKGAIDRVLVTLIDYAEKISKYGTSKVKFVATSAVRDANNKDIFLQAAEEITGIKPEILDGNDEARFSFVGATKSIPDIEGPSLVIDIGGGSTEFAFGNEKLELSHSADIGCVRISERFIENDPALPEELSAAQSLIDLHLDDVLMEIPAIHSAKNIIGVAGTISATSMIEQGLHDYSFELVHNHVMSKQSIEEVFRLLATDSREGRLSNPGMEQGRVDVIVGGLCILVQIMRKLDFEELQVSEKDILDGLVLSLL
jgi:exopolyphosphatase/guanosine-5'-triphosphate,3'-diphosphate pyrophosphatase|tara:strand:+ start:62464 stop:63384 length:921 start_codon:yes stop_codon:yes gene_type:complete